MFKRIENTYLNYFRYTLIVIATLAIIFGGINLLISIIKIGDSPSRVEIQIPKWSEIKFDVLPISKTSKANPIKSDQKEVSEDILERKIDSRIIIIVNNIDELFTSEDRKFSNYYSPKFIDEWIKNSSLPSRYRNQFLDGIVSFSADLKDEIRIKQIGSIEDRVEIIIISLETFLVEFIDEIQSTERQNQNLIEESITQNNIGYQQIINTGYALAAFIFILIIILVFKIEANLREISPAIRKKE
tara:strand:- start:1392 stop:2123 length:732 start_codon:yes stop_codon:yes gene_type:complete